MTGAIPRQASWVAHTEFSGMYFPGVILMAIVGGSSVVAALAMMKRTSGWPLFTVLAGVIMNNGGIALLLINAAKVMVGRAPGALAQTNVAANALFGAVSGSAATRGRAPTRAVTGASNATAKPFDPVSTASMSG